MEETTAVTVFEAVGDYLVNFADGATSILTGFGEFFGNVFADDSTFLTNLNWMPSLWLAVIPACITVIVIFRIAGR